MEVPGRKGRTYDRGQNLASSEDFEVFCQPCGEDGKRLPGAKYCQQCKEYLCKNCCELHMKVKPAKYHDLVDISRVTSILGAWQGKTSAICKVHPGKIVEFFCPTHKCNLCYVCSVLNHKSCNVEYKGEINVSQKPIQKTVSKQSYTGVSKQNVVNASISRLPDINAKSSDDRYDCEISGMTFIPPRTLLLADYKNKCIKSLDISSQTIISRLPLSSEPQDITTFGQDQAAVTFRRKEELQIISTNRDLSEICTIKVNGFAKGIDATEDKLIVSYLGGVMEVLDYHGAVLHKITNSSGEPLFEHPLYVCVATEKGQEVIYVSDSNTHIITKLSMTGEVLWTYEDKDLTEPTGLTVTDDGYIVVCGRDTDNIQVLSPDGRKVRTLLTKTDGPYSVVYNSRQQVLYVTCSCWSNSNAKMRAFELK